MSLITQRTLAPFRGILFDMDGVLLDSEPFWRLAQMEVFAELGKHLTEADCVETTGIRIDQVVAYRVPQADRKATVRAILDRMIYLVEERGRPIAGVRETLIRLKEMGVPLGLATSSPYDLLEATLKSLDLREFFPVVHSAQEEEYGKPHPAVYLSAAGKLGIPPQECVAIEDSVNGVISAKAARMGVVVVPEAAEFEDSRFCLAEIRSPRLDLALPILENCYIH